MALTPREIRKLIDMIGTPPQDRDEFEAQCRMTDKLIDMLPVWYDPMEDEELEIHLREVEAASDP